MAGVVDSNLFAELAARRKEEIIQPGWCAYSEVEGGYIVKAWNENYIIRPEREEIQAMAGDGVPHEYFCVFLINYLLAEKSSKPGGQWISEKDLSGGATFFRGPHAIPTYLISESFGNDLAALEKAGAFLHGRPLELADSAFSFEVIHTVKLALLYWLGDDDFPPEAKLLIDSSLSGVLQLDAIFALLYDTCKRLALQPNTR